MLFLEICGFLCGNFSIFTTTSKNTNAFLMTKSNEKMTSFALNPTMRMFEMTSNCRKTYLRKYWQIVFKGWFGPVPTIL